eukprot:UN04162
MEIGTFSDVRGLLGHNIRSPRKYKNSLIKEPLQLNDLIIFHPFICYVAT